MILSEVQILKNRTPQNSSLLSDFDISNYGTCHKKSFSQYRILLFASAQKNVSIGWLLPKRAQIYKDQNGPIFILIVIICDLACKVAPVLGDLELINYEAHYCGGSSFYRPSYSPASTFKS